MLGGKNVSVQGDLTIHGNLTVGATNTVLVSGVLAISGSLFNVPGATIIVNASLS